jgi:hypothetical protein
MSAIPLPDFSKSDRKNSNISPIIGQGKMIQLNNMTNPWSNPRKGTPYNLYDIGIHK